MEKNKKIIAILAVAAFAGGLLGTMFGNPFLKANEAGATAQNAGLLGDFYNNYIKPYLPNFGPGNATSSTAPSKVIPYSPTIDYEEAVVKAVEKASPAVVSIIISKDMPIIEQCPYDPFGDLPPEFQQFFGGDLNREFTQPCQKGFAKQEVGGGSGFVISPDGLVVTNKHVVFDTKADYTVLTNDGKKYDAKVLARDSTRDLAIVKITASNLPVLNLGDSDSIKLGQTAIAIGNALGEFRNTVSVGVISGLSRNVTAQGAGLSEKIEGLIQTDAAINAGNSGGPLLNLKGEVIGINVAMVSGAQSIGFAIPINQVKKAIESVKATGEIQNAYLGVRYLPIDADAKAKEKLSVDYGALVRGTQDGPAVIKNSPAAKAGIRAEDILLEVAGEKITAENSLSALIAKHSVGETVNLKVLRNGQEMNVPVLLEKRPENL